MKVKIMRVIIILISIFIMVTYFWKALLPNQLQYTINEYSEEISFHNETTFKIHDTAEWLNGELVAVEGKEMVGVVYLEKFLGVYKVKNHALCNKIDNVKDSSMGDVDYQYRLLRAKSFVDDKDILMAYINDADLNSFELEDNLNEIRFQLPENRELILNEVNQLTSNIKTESNVINLIDEVFIEWKDKNLQSMIKYNANNFTYKSNTLLNIAVIGSFRFNTDDSILINNILLSDTYDLNSEEYDALFVNIEISNETLNELVNENWEVYIIDPLKNIESFGNTYVKDNVIIYEKSKNGSGSSFKTDYYNLESNYLMAYSRIFERLSYRKK